MKRLYAYAFFCSFILVGLSGCKTLQAINDDLNALNNRNQQQNGVNNQTTYTKQAETKKYSTIAYYPKQMVREVQSSLNQRGYNAGTADGLYGMKTNVAVKAYQKDQGLPVSEKLDERTVSSLGVIYLTNTPNNSHSITPIPSAKETAVINTNESAITETKKEVLQPAVEKAAVVNMTVTERTDVKTSADPFSSNIGTVRAGQKIDVIQQSGSWYKVRFNGGEGFIYSEFLRK